MTRRRSTIQRDQGRRNPFAGALRLASRPEANGDGPTLQIEVLTPLAMRRRGLPLPPLRPAPRRLASLLLLTDGDRISIDTLIEAFWVDSPPRSARRAIHTHVCAIRRLVGDDVIQTIGDGYRWAVEHCVIDVDRFERAADRAATAWRAGDAVMAVRHADAARRHWHGTPYAAIADDEIARPRIVQLRMTAATTSEVRASALLGLGRGGEATADLVQAVSADPLDERLVELLARTYVACERPAAGAKVIDTHRRHLAESGLALSPRLVDIERRLVCHEPIPDDRFVS